MRPQAGPVAQRQKQKSEGLVGVSMVGEERAQIHAKDKTSTQRGGDVEAGHFQYVGGSGGTGKSTWLIKAIQTVIDIKGVKNVQYSMPQVSDERCKQRWRRRKVLIVDEVGMLGSARSMSGTSRMIGRCKGTGGNWWLSDSGKSSVEDYVTIFMLQKRYNTCPPGCHHEQIHAH